MNLTAIIRELSPEQLKLYRERSACLGALLSSGHNLRGEHYAPCTMVNGESPSSVTIRIKDYPHFIEGGVIPEPVKAVIHVGRPGLVNISKESNNEIVSTYPLNVSNTDLHELKEIMGDGEAIVAYTLIEDDATHKRISSIFKLDGECLQFLYSEDLPKKPEIKENIATSELGIEGKIKSDREFTLTEAARATGKSRSYMYQYIKQGLEVYGEPGKQRVRESRLRSFYLGKKDEKAINKLNRSLKQGSYEVNKKDSDSSKSNLEERTLTRISKIPKTQLDFWFNSLSEVSRKLDISYSKLDYARRKKGLPVEKKGRNSRVNAKDVFNYFFQTKNDEAINHLLDHAESRHPTSKIKKKN